MIEEMVSETGKGVFRGIGYLLSELLFWRLCYVIGWPVCKLVTFGRYPRRLHRERAIFRQHNAHTGFTCAAVGLLIVVALLLGLSGNLPHDLPHFGGAGG
ncbi:hypothetical protein [Alteromonas lipolytica]|uniref:Uncharacterized protein n=1 Tax=Alteromonas lipolytica TaxID=1856405 RepID=A0A1E8F930_9ALTE|nr:hypothetical protein [Alteromonas lipolytica]OFI32431.1 hypothetical protein BFC17_06865 [Alteromonas lipolytica]GGF79725.1 hypothetical protein GCM10011338_35090 [Alteromonas lipolytica]